MWEAKNRYIDIDFVIDEKVFFHANFHPLFLRDWAFKIGDESLGKKNSVTKMRVKASVVNN